MNAFNPPIRQPDPFADADALDDAIEAEREALRAECEEEFAEWVRDGIRGLGECDNNPREDASFSDWLVRMAQPHMRDHQKYAAAMDWRERSRVDFAGLAKGLRDYHRRGFAA